MTIDKIHFEELFPVGIYANQRLRVEATVSEKDDITESYKSLKTLVHSAFQAMNPHLYTESGKPITIEQVEPEDNRIKTLIQDINQCTEIDRLNPFDVQVGLLAFAKLAGSNPEIKAAYDLKLKMLQNV